MKILLLALFTAFTFQFSYSQTKDNYTSVTSDVKYQYIGTYDLE